MYAYILHTYIHRYIHTYNHFGHLRFSFEFLKEKHSLSIKDYNWLLFILKLMTLLYQLGVCVTCGPIKPIVPSLSVQ